MLDYQQLNIDDYAAIVRRRKWVILLPTLLCAVGAYLVSLMIPNEYTSVTLVLVEDAKVPDSFVKSVVTEDLNDRLATMKEQILSRSRLEPIIEKFGLYREQRGNKMMEDLVDKLRRSIVVTPVRAMPGTKPGGLSGFYISVTTDQPRMAQQVCAEVTSMFMQENIRLREQRARGTTNFLQSQLEEAKRDLDQQDAQMAEFKRRYLGQLPGQEQMNLNILMGLNTQLDAVNQGLTRAQQDKTYAESLLAQQVTAWKASQAGANPQTLEQQLASLQDMLAILEASYTNSHPDVVKLKNDIARLKKRIAESPKTDQNAAENKALQASLSEPPQIQGLRLQIHQLDTTIREKTREQEDTQKQIKLYRERVQLSPTVEQQYKDLTRDYQTALANYNDLLRKRTESEMATDLERRQQGEQFRVMDPPFLPSRPSSPNRPMIAGGGFGGGLMLGLAIALLLEMRDKALRSERDIERHLRLPTLALLPTLDAGGPRNRLWGERSPKQTGELKLRVEA